jgi:hypothetical protein
MANQYLKLRRSSVPGKFPDTASLDFGEIALNTYDGLAFMKKDGPGGIEVVPIGSNQGTFTGSFSGSFVGNLDGTASCANNSTSSSYSDFAISSSYAYTASSAVNAYYAITSSQAYTASSADYFLVRNSITASNALINGVLTTQTLVVQTISSSVIYSSGSNIFGDELTDKQTFTGSVEITGSLSVNGSSVVLIDQTGSMSVASASYALTASFLIGYNPYQIATGSVTASVNTNPDSVFLIKSGSVYFLNISSSGNTTLSSDLFIVKNLTSQQPVLIVSQSIVKIVTQSLDPSGTTDAGSIWFTSAAMYIGLE